MDHDNVDAALVERAQAARRRIRISEFKAVADYLAPNQLVLDYGAGSGFMSTLLAELGCRVEAVDVDTRPWMYWPVRLYDGVRLPYPDGYFDVVFTCFALEHLPDLPRCLREMARVLKRDGRMIHIVPTASWRLWSNVTHLLLLARKAARGFSFRRRKRPTAAGAGNGRRGFKALIPPPHGELASNSVSEIGQYLLARWRRTFSNASLEVVAERRTGVFDAEHLLLANLSDQSRVGLARVLGSSGYVFVLRPRPTDSPR